jgi:crotonobetainyl-CoA:carnitine CoA-transferase CaiB-like acyl-CoA transferase
MVEALDAATPGGRRRLIGLLREASGLVENFRPRVLGNLDLHPLPLRPSPTHVALPGFPACSPRANWRSVGFQLEACQGLGVQPLADAPAVVAVGATPLVSDLASALLAAGSVVTLPPGSTVELAQAKTLRRAGVLRW